MIKEKKKTPEEHGGFPSLFKQGFSEPWARAFRKNTSLIHVDMSHNNIRLDDVEIIAEGLKENHSILGLHFVGNEGDVDVKGFVNPQVPFSVGGGAAVTRLPTSLQSGVVVDSRKIELRSVSNCWICEGWSQHLFIYRPGVSDDRIVLDPHSVIKLHLDIDHFEGDKMLPTEGDPDVRQLWRMLPPGKRKYFYSVDNTIQVAKD